MGESKIEPYFKIIKDKNHKIRSAHRDKVTHEIMDYDENKQHEYHESGAKLRSDEKSKLLRLLAPYIILVVIVIIIMIIIIYYLNGKFG